jgi:hypothetical protein
VVDKRKPIQHRASARRELPFERIVSGGQTGADRAALDFAIAHSIPHGGWCPRGRLAEDGALEGCYELRETPEEEYPQRTEWNVRDSDGTLILTEGPLTGGTLATAELARDRFRRPLLVLDFEAQPDPGAVLPWLRAHDIQVLNVAGPRESHCPGIHARATAFLTDLFAGLAGAR